jgi:biopolymer transport protein ExbD
MRFPRQARMFTGQLDVAPVACVLLLVLMFLALQSYLAPVPGVAVHLPASDRSLDAGYGPWLVLAVDREGRLFFDHQITTEARLADQLASRAAKAASNLRLLVQADEQVPQGTLVRLYALARGAGLHSVLLQTRPNPLASAAASPP